MEGSFSPIVYLLSLRTWKSSVRIRGGGVKTFGVPERLWPLIRQRSISGLCGSQQDAKNDGALNKIDNFVFGRKPR